MSSKNLKKICRPFEIFGWKGTTDVVQKNVSQESQKVGGQE